MRPRGPAQQITLGRAEDCDIRLPDPKLSRHHCSFALEGERLFVEDLDSKNGTQVNGPSIERRTELHEGDRVQVGSHVLVVRFPEPAEPTPEEVTQERAASREAPAPPPPERRPEPGPPAESLEGRQLAGLAIGQTLYEGRSCVIYRARGEGAQRAAVKVLRPAAASSERELKRFQRGGKIAAKLEHPGLVRVLRSATEGQTAYQVMELVEADNLEDILSRREDPMEVDRALGLVRQVLKALQYLGERRLLMRNVRPDNVLLTQEEEARLVDYDLLRPLPAAQRSRITTVEEAGPLEKDGRFAAPEMIARPKVADQRCDVFGAGACLYYMLTRTAPFPEEPRAPHRAFDRMPPDPRKMNPGIPDGVAELILRAMSARVDARYHDAAQMISALDEA
jgi:serine/threonine protein kinase